MTFWVFITFNFVLRLVIFSALLITHGVLLLHLVILFFVIGENCVPVSYKAVVRLHFFLTRGALDSPYSTPRFFS